MKKVNPKRRPATWADVERARKEATDEAVQLAMCIVLTVLVDKFNGRDYIQDIWKAVNKLSEEIVEGRVNMTDLKHVLLTEYDVEIK